MPRQKIADLRGAAYAARNLLLGDDPISDQQIKDSLVSMLATRKLTQEAMDLEKFRSAQSVETRYNQLKQSFESMTSPYVLKKLKLNLKTFLERDQNFETIERAFHRAIVGSEVTAGMEDLNPELFPTGREQIRALQKRLKNGNLPQREQKLKALSQIMAAREVLNVRFGVRGGDPSMDQKLPSESFRKAANDYESTLQTLSDREINDLSAKALSGHGGELTKEFHLMMRKKVSRQEAVPKDLPKRYWPSAQTHIETMQEKLKTARTPAEQQQCLARIIAARQLTGARRGNLLGGDSALSTLVDPQQLTEREKEVSRYLSRFSEEEKSKLVRQAGSGHGGEMMESYKKLNTYSAQCAWMRFDARRENPSVDMAEAMALQNLYRQNMNGLVDENRVRTIVNAIRNEPGYTEFTQDPNMKQLLKDGRFTALAEKFQENVVNQNRNAVVEEGEQPNQGLQNRQQQKKINEVQQAEGQGLGIGSNF